jgi:hypothetical protein
MLTTLDILAAIMVLLALFKAPKDRRWWLLYAVGCCVYIFVFYCKGIWGAVVLDVVAAIIGFKNFKG